MSDETDAFGRPRRPETTDPFGTPVESEPAPEEPVASTGWAPPSPPSSDETVASWAPPVSPAGAPGDEPSGWWRRVGAAVVDALVVGVAAAIIGAILSSATDASDDGTTGIGLGLGLVLAGLYYGLFMSRQGANNGQTLGKQAAGIRVVRLNGEQVTFGFVLLRELVVKTFLFGYLAIFTLYLATLLNYLWPLWDPQNQALHDKIVRTQVRRTS